MYIFPTQSSELHSRYYPSIDGYYRSDTVAHDMYELQDYILGLGCTRPGELPTKAALGLSWDGVEATATIIGLLKKRRHKARENWGGNKST